MEIRRKLKDLKGKIDAKDEEIKLKDSEIGVMNKKVNDKILNLENKIGDIEFKLNEIMKENNLLKEIINSKSEGLEKTLEVQETIRETKKDYLCNECDFIGKSEPGLKVHKAAKHKDTNLNGYRKINKV